MKFRSIALAAVAVASFGAQAGALSTYQPWDDFYPDAKGIDGVKFNVVSAQLWIARLSRRTLWL